MKFSECEVELIARTVHELWMEGKLAEGYVYGLGIDKELKTHHCLVPYDRLRETDKESDRHVARGIPEILSRSGYAIISQVDTRNWWTKVLEGPQ